MELTERRAISEYPKRPSFFSTKFTRLLVKYCIAQELGPKCFVLLVTIAATEDAKSYRSPVTFSNHQLMPIIGATSERQLIDIREACITSGWLIYIRGAKGVPGIYWVLIPSRYDRTEDTPVDEVPGELFPVKSDRESDRETENVLSNQTGKVTGKHTGKHTGEGAAILPMPFPNPSPKKKPLTPFPEIPKNLDTQEFRRTWEEFMAHRREKGKFTTRAANMIFKEMSEWPVAKAIRALEISIASGWSGVFEPKEFQNGRANSSGSTSTTHRPTEEFQYSRRVVSDADMRDPFSPV
jgi:hypothetical protein